MEPISVESAIFHEGHDHFHDHDMPGEWDEDHPMWRSERIILISVGIDIGSSTSHLIFSRLLLRRQGAALSSRFVVVQRDILSESPILLTPYLDKTTIDTQKLGQFIEESYRQAQLTPDDIDTGALILTGEATKKKNAEAVAALFSAQAGKFVCATAGHNLEAVLAAYGSGAVEATFEEEKDDFTLMNVDIGGGTSKVAIVRRGRIVDTAALEVGARLLAFDQQGKIDRLEDSVLKIGEAAGVRLGLGGTLAGDEKEAMAKTLTTSLFEVLGRGTLSPLTQRLLLTPPIAFKERIDALAFSGGVSEYIYGFEGRDLGDLGNQLGNQGPGDCSGFHPPGVDAAADSGSKDPRHGHWRFPVYGSSERKHHLPFQWRSPAVEEPSGGDPESPRERNPGEIRGQIGGGARAPAL